MISPAMNHPHCKESESAEGLDQVSFRSSLQTQMPTKARQVKKCSQKERGPVLPKKDYHYLFIVSGHHEDSKTHVARALIS